MLFTDHTDYAVPYGFSALSPSVAKNTINTIRPITGIKPKSCHQPVRLVSCRRRAPTAWAGIKVANEKNNEIFVLSKLMAMNAKKQNKMNHQNSVRFAHPVKSA